MKLSTMSLVLCFAVAPIAARAMVQHRDVLHRVQRQAMPICAIAFILADKSGNNSAEWIANCGNVDSDDQF
jgi:hypothetical protein